MSGRGKAMAGTKRWSGKAALAALLMAQLGLGAFHPQRRGLDGLPAGEGLGLAVQDGVGALVRRVAQDVERPVALLRPVRRQPRGLGG